MVPTRVSMPSLGKWGEENDIIISRTGMKQGCPISPLLYIIVYDLLIEEMKRKRPGDTVSAYVDDMGVVMGDPKGVKTLTEVYERYGKAEL
jgi:Reverse transcriptase (RNA-dependent DNA polymerase)